MELQPQSFRWVFRVDSFWIDWFDLLAVRRTFRSRLLLYPTSPLKQNTTAAPYCNSDGAGGREWWPPSGSLCFHPVLESRCVALWWYPWPNLKSILFSECVCVCVYICVGVGERKQAIGEIKWVPPKRADCRLHISGIEMEWQREFWILRLFGERRIIFIH